MKNKDRCHYCGVGLTDAAQVDNKRTRDHLVPVAHGGKWSDGWVWACCKCNGKRGRGEYKRFVFWINALQVRKAQWEQPPGYHPLIKGGDKFRGCELGAARRYVVVGGMKFLERDGKGGAKAKASGHFGLVGFGQHVAQGFGKAGEGEQSCGQVVAMYGNGDGWADRYREAGEDHDQNLLGTYREVFGDQVLDFFGGRAGLEGQGVVEAATMAEAKAEDGEEVGRDDWPVGLVEE